MTFGKALTLASPSPKFKNHPETLSYTFIRSLPYTYAIRAKELKAMALASNRDRFREALPFVQQGASPREIQPTMTEEKWSPRARLISIVVLVASLWTVIASMAALMLSD